MVALLMIPHFDFPFRFVNSTAAVVEQDSLEDITNCVTAIAATVQGERIERPSFGIPDPTFDRQPLDLQGILQAVTDGEPRAHTLIDQAPDRIDQLIAHITLSVAQQTPQEGV